MIHKLKQDIFVVIAAGIFIGAVIFDILPEVNKDLHLWPSLLLVVIGAGVWFGLKKLADAAGRSGLAVVAALAFWFHSALEGAVTALSFSASFTTGLIVAAGMVLHLVPEFFAITALLKGEGISTKRSVQVDLFSIAILIISFTGLTFWLPGFSESTLHVLASLSGGAFLYIGAASFLKRPKTIKNVVALGVGLIVAALWNFLIGK